MATQRYISTSFWDDGWIQTLIPDEKLLYLYLMTNPLTNIAGVYKISTRRICFDTGFNSDTVGHILSKFEQAKKAHRLGEYIVLPAWPRHQKWDTKKAIKDGIDIILSSLPNEIREQLVSLGYCYPIMGGPSPHQPSYSDLDSDIDLDIDSDINKRAGKPPRVSFTKPTIEEVREYCTERGRGVDPEAWMDHYVSNDWHVGKNKMKDWRAAVRTWERTGFSKREESGLDILARIRREESRGTG